MRWRKRLTKDGGPGEGPRNERQLERQVEEERRQQTQPARQQYRELETETRGWGLAGRKEQRKEEGREGLPVTLSSHTLLSGLSSLTQKRKRGPWGR